MLSSTTDVRERLKGVRYSPFDSSYGDEENGTASFNNNFTSPRNPTNQKTNFPIMKWIQQVIRNKMMLLILIIVVAVIVTIGIAVKLVPNAGFPRPPSPTLPVITIPVNHNHHEHHHMNTNRVILHSSINRTYSLPQKCMNTKQGFELITDDMGAICARNQVDVASGCCNELIDRLTCSSCRTDVECCASYEYCVSCCLKNTKTNTLQFPSDTYHKCLSLCRTSSRSLKHGNKYKHKHKYCYTDGEHDISFNATSAKIMAAERGYSCSLSCQSQRLVCHDTYLPKINNCEYLKKYFTCEKGCENGQGSDQPAYVVPDAPESFPRGLCLVNTDQKLFDCESAHENTRRLCVCIPPEAVDQ